MSENWQDLGVVTTYGRIFINDANWVPDFGYEGSDGARGAKGRQCRQLQAGQRRSPE